MPGVIQTIKAGATEHPKELLSFLEGRIVAASGIFDIINDGFLVEQLASPVMKIQVNTGFAVLVAVDGNTLYPVWLHGGTLEADVTSNGSGSGRKDAVVLYYDEAEGANDICDNVAKIAVVAGTPSGSPANPDTAAIQAVIGANNAFFVLAYLTVASAATNIVDANIADARKSPSIKISNPIFPITYASTITPNCNNSNQQSCILTAAVTVAAPTNMEVGGWLALEFIENGTGTYDVTWFTGITWMSPDTSMNTAANKRTQYAIHKLSNTTYEGFLVGKEY